MPLTQLREQVTLRTGASRGVGAALPSESQRVALAKERNSSVAPAIPILTMTVRHRRRPG